VSEGWPLTEFQVEVARLFFTLPESEGFLPASTSALGPTFALEELAGRKLIALFDRAEARDFADVYALAQRYDTGLLLQRAAEIDPGFDLEVFATMLGSLDRFTDAELPVGDADVAALREFFRRWRAQLDDAGPM
jgi:hypothetical protein